MTGKSKKELTEKEQQLIDNLLTLLGENSPTDTQDNDTDFNKQMLANIAILKQFIADSSNPFLMKKFLDCADKTKEDDQLLIWLIFAAVAIAIATIVIAPLFPWFALIALVAVLTLLTAYLENQPTETWLETQETREKIGKSMHELAETLDPETYADATGYASFFYCNPIKTICDNIKQQEYHGNYCKEG